MNKDKLKESILKVLSDKFSDNKNLLQFDMKRLATDISQSIISRYNLVTHEELQAEKKVLEKAQVTIKQLEERIKSLEESLKN